MKSSWSDSKTKQKSPLDLLVYRSRLIGQEANLCVWGGGNTSSKVMEKDHLGRKIKVLRVKGSGSDLKSCEGHHFSPLRLDEIMPALDKKSMTDEAMVDYLQRCLVNPKAPRPSIEALLHGFLPYQAIDHTHADAILSLTNTSRPREICKQVFGDDLIFISYVKPGFDLAKKVARAVARNPLAKGAVLEKHGLITWAEDSETSYRLTIRMVSKAEKYIAKKSKGRRAFGGQKIKPLSSAQRLDFVQKYVPEIRGFLSNESFKIVRFNDSKEVLEFVCSKLAPTVSQEGPATPDHMLRTKRVPLYLDLPANPLKADVANLGKQIERYRKAHAKYYKQYRSRGMYMLDPNPVVILIPGVGLLTAAKDLKSAEIASEIYEHSISVMKAASFIDRYKSLSPKLAFEIEYWPLELYKMSLAPAEREFARKVVVVTGACGGIGQAVARQFAEQGAHVVVTDIAERKAQVLAESINYNMKSPVALGLAMNVTREQSIQQALRKIIERFGGVDIVVSNAGVATVSTIDKLPLSEWERNIAVNATGHFLVSREMVKLMHRQNTGGAFVFVVTKNVLAPGAEFGAYSASKAASAQLARIIAIEGAPFNIRSNMVNPDGVFDGSGLWSMIKQTRAKTYGIKGKDLEEFYRKRNLMQVRIEPDDVAESVLFLASPKASKTTGAMLPVDGGLKEAFPR